MSETAEQRSRREIDAVLTAAGWQVLAHALLVHAQASDVSHEEETIFGIRYIIEGKMQTPDGRDPRIRAIWFVERGELQPRFVTAYPLGGRQI